MALDRSRVWRVLFVVGGVLYFVGGFHHPRGMVMADMLVDPAWIPSHAAVLVGVIAMTAGLVSFRSSRALSPALDRWLLFAIVMSAAEAVEMGLHTIAYLDASALDHGALHGGRATPLLSLHLLLATLVYTPFAVALIGLIWRGQRERALGSPWIGWIGIVGALAHGSVMWLAIVIGVGWSGILFPIGALCLSLWFVLAGLWPVRQPAAGSADPRSAPSGSPAAG